MKNLKNELNELQKEHDQKIECAILKNELVEKSLPVHLVYYGFRDRLCISFNPVSFAEARKVKEWIENTGAMPYANLTFASKDETKTCSPYLLKFDNMDHEGKALSNGAKITCKTLKYDITIDVNPRWYHGDILANDRKQLRHLGFGRYSSKNIMYLDMFGKQRYYGDTVYNYCEYPEQKEEFEFTLFHGHVAEFAHLVEH